MLVSYWRLQQTEPPTLLHMIPATAGAALQQARSQTQMTATMAACSCCAASPSVLKQPRPGLRGAARRFPCQSRHCAPHSKHANASSLANCCSRRCRLGRGAANSQRWWPKCAHTLLRKKTRCKRWTKRAQLPCASCAALCSFLLRNCLFEDLRQEFALHGAACKSGRPLGHQGQVSGQCYGRNARTCKLPARIQ